MILVVEAGEAAAPPAFRAVSSGFDRPGALFPASVLCARAVIGDGARLGLWRVRFA